jgi:hypothetical protein
MAQAFTTGPALFFVNPNVQGQVAVSPGLGTASPPIFLGTSEQAPKIELHDEWEPIFNDLSGKVPYDMSYQGEMAHTFASLTRWNEPVLAVIQKRTRLGANIRGLDQIGDIGSLMLTQGQAYTLWVVFPFVTNPAFSTGGMPAGYRFPASYLKGPDDMPIGTRARKVGIIWESLRAYDPTRGLFLLYDHNMAAVNRLPIN